MDPRSFDALTKSLAAPKTRRGLLGSLAALGAGLIGARSGDAQVTQAQCGNKTCAADPGVCTNGCVCCVYGNGNSRCRPPQECTGTVVSPRTTTTTTTAAPTTTTTSTTTTSTTTTTTTTTTTSTTTTSTSTTPPPTTTTTTTPLPLIFVGELVESDPSFADMTNCVPGPLYDAYTFTHGGGALSINVRGIDTDGGTLVDPFVFLFQGSTVPVNPCVTNLGFDDNEGCQFDAYMTANLPAGTYTMAVLSATNQGLGTYTVERNTFTITCG